MAKLLYEYKSLEDTLLKLKRQVLDSLSFANKFIPETITTPEELFYFLKQHVIYLDDPKTRELLMTMQTMLKGNRTGLPGGGDCDDFTITSLACLHVIGFNDLKLVLVGYKIDVPTHVYAAVNANGLKWFDLTNDHFNQQRTNGTKGTYKFQQIFNFSI